jgi:acetoin utilization deacetylase AcuC-like enzyme
LSRLGFHTDRLFLQHNPGVYHPECPARLEAIRQSVVDSGLEFAAVDGRQLDGGEWANQVHSRAYLQELEAACLRAPRRLDPDTVVSRESYRVALAAVEAALAAADAVLAGRLDRAFVALRPPGHHAERERAMGFCLLNNVAVAARYAQRAHGLERVLIVDWDVHHGNGTQHLFEADPTVFYFSIHQAPLYPGTGAREERGRGKGLGATLNVPVPPGSDDQTFLEALERELVPAAAAFRPELILLSAGFDAHRDDPLAQCRVTTPGYQSMARVVAGLAEELCAGRLVALLEGGYDLQALGASVVACLRGLT